MKRPRRTLLAILASLLMAAFLTQGVSHASVNPIPHPIYQVRADITQFHTSWTQSDVQLNANLGWSKSNLTTSGFYSDANNPNSLPSVTQSYCDYCVGHDEETYVHSFDMQDKITKGIALDFSAQALWRNWAGNLMTCNFHDHVDFSLLTTAGQDRHLACTEPGGGTLSLTYNAKLVVPKLVTSPTATGNYYWLTTLSFESVLFPSLHDCGIFQSGECDHTSNAYGGISLMETEDVYAWHNGIHLDFLADPVHDNVTYTASDLQDTNVTQTEAYRNGVNPVVLGLIEDRDSVSGDDEICALPARTIIPDFVYNKGVAPIAYSIPDNGYGSCNLSAYVTVVPVTYYY